MISDFSLGGGFNTSKFALHGSSWTESFVSLSDGSSPANDGQVWRANSDPAFAIDKLGNVYLANLDLNANSPANGFYASVGTLSGGVVSFTVANTFPVAANTSLAATITEDKEWITVDNSGNAATTGNVYAS